MRALERSNTSVKWLVKALVTGLISVLLDEPTRDSDTKIKNINTLRLGKNAQLLSDLTSCRWETSPSSTFLLDGV